jgi:CRP-like cAMP-binding protein
MEYHEVKNGLKAGLQFAGLDETTAATLLWRGEEQTLCHGEIIYAEGEELDQTFCLLLSGSLEVSHKESVVAGVAQSRFFGEMAYFANPKTRGATVTVSSSEAVILRFHLTTAELASPRFRTLRQYLSHQKWDRIMALAA